MSSTPLICTVTVPLEWLARSIDIVDKGNDKVDIDIDIDIDLKELAVNESCSDVQTS